MFAALKNAMKYGRHRGRLVGMGKLQGGASAENSEFGKSSYNLECSLYVNICVQINKYQNVTTKHSN